MHNKQTLVNFAFSETRNQTIATYYLKKNKLQEFEIYKKRK